MLPRHRSAEHRVGGDDIGTVGLGEGEALGVQPVERLEVQGLRRRLHPARSSSVDNATPCQCTFGPAIR